MFLLPIFAALSFLQAGATPVHPAPGAVVATVDGAPLTAGEVDPYLWEWKSREVIDELVLHRIVAAEAQKKGLTASDAEVKTRVDEQVKLAAANVPPGQSVDDFIKARGGMSRLALVARSAVLVDKLAALEFKPADYVKVATLLFKYDGASTATMTKAIKSADSAYAALQSGKAWDAVLRQNETDARVVSSGGLIGWKAVSLFPQSVQAQFSTLKPLGYTKPTQTEYGIQIFRVLARGATATPAELGELKAQFVQGTRAALVARLRQAAKVEIK